VSVGGCGQPRSGGAGAASVKGRFFRKEKPAPRALQQFDGVPGRVALSNERYLCAVLQPEVPPRWEIARGGADAPYIKRPDRSNGWVGIGVAPGICVVVLSPTAPAMPPDPLPRSAHLATHPISAHRLRL